MMETAATRRRKEKEAEKNLEKERGWNSTFALKRHESRRWQQMSQDIKNLVSNQVPYGGLLGRPTSIDAIDSPSAFSSITNTFKFEHHNGTDGGLELRVLKYIMIREGLIMSLTHACEKLVKLSDRDMEVPNDLKTEILDGLSQIRDATVDLLEIICMWRLSSPDNRADMPLPFIWEGQNYVLKIVSDLNFMGNLEPLVTLLNISPYKMVLNPLMLPNTLIEGGLWIGPEERASFDAGGATEGHFYNQRLQLRRAERVLLQEVEVYDAQMQMSVHQSNGFHAESFSLDNDPQHQEYGQGPPMSSSSGQMAYSSVPTTGGAVAPDTSGLGLNDWGFSVNIADETNATDFNYGMDEAGGGQFMGGIAPEFASEYGYDAPPDYARPMAAPSGSRSGSRNGSRGGQGQSQTVTSRIRGLPSQPLAPVVSSPNSKKLSTLPSGVDPVFGESSLARDPVDSIKVVERDFTGLEGFNTGVPGAGRTKAHSNPKPKSKITSESEPPLAKTKKTNTTNTNRMPTQVPMESIGPIEPYDIELVISLTTPPRQMLLAAAAIVILVEPSQEYPNDVSWNAFLDLATYTDLAWEMNNISINDIPKFKIRAISPFLENIDLQNLNEELDESQRYSEYGPESDEFPPSPMTDGLRDCIRKMIMWVMYMTETSLTRTVNREPTAPVNRTDSLSKPRSVLKPKAKLEKEAKEAKEANAKTKAKAKAKAKAKSPIKPTTVQKNEPGMKADAKYEDESKTQTTGSVESRIGARGNNTGKKSQDAARTPSSINEKKLESKSEFKSDQNRKADSKMKTKIESKNNAEKSKSVTPSTRPSMGPPPAEPHPSELKLSDVGSKEQISSDKTLLMKQAPGLNDAFDIKRSDSYDMEEVVIEKTKHDNALGVIEMVPENRVGALSFSGAVDSKAPTNIADDIKEKDRKKMEEDEEQYGDEDFEVDNKNSFASALASSSAVRSESGGEVEVEASLGELIASECLEPSNSMVNIEESVEDDAKYSNSFDNDDMCVDAVESVLDTKSAGKNVSVVSSVANTADDYRDDFEA
jgi:hypothetical protein